MSQKIGLFLIVISGILMIGGTVFLFFHPIRGNVDGPNTCPGETSPGETLIIAPGNNSSITVYPDSESPKNNTNSTQSNPVSPQANADSTQTNVGSPQENTDATQTNASSPQNDTDATQTNASSPQNDSNSTQSNASTPSPTDLAEFVNSSNLFALEMYSNLTNPSDNLFFSPYSIFTAIGMVYEGARNKTADEIRSVFHFPADSQTRWSLFKALIEKMNSGKLGCNLSTANAIWVQEGFKILSEYMDALQTYYKVNAFYLDYIKATEEARLRINSWVENQTNGMIKDLIPQGVLTPMTSLVLTNAIYFKGDWLKPFDPSLTKEGDFHTGTGATVKAEMMCMRNASSVFAYAESDGAQFLDMPYKGEKLSMLFILPKEGAMGSLENNLTQQKLSEWREKMEQQRVDVYIPRFRLETKYTLNHNLSAMGMPTAFTEFADFSGIDGYPDLFISQVIHQAYVSVNESGTEAAAATAIIGVGAGQGEHKIPIFNADHPFIFLIQDDETGNILFMGKVVDPTR